MSALYYDNSSAAADGGGDSDRPRCSCLPFCFGRRIKSRRTEPRGAESPVKWHRRRRWRRFRLVIRLSSWLAFSWPPPWLRLKKSGKKEERTKASTTTGKKKRTGRRLLLLLRTSLHAKQALASVVVSGDGGGLLPVAATAVSSFGNAKKQNRSRPRPAADGAAPPPSGTGSQPQASTAATGTRSSGRTASALSVMATDEPAIIAGRIWRAPSRQHSLQPHQGPVRSSASGLWAAATTLGVIVFFGRVTAVVFLCSCLYGARFVRARAAGASAKNSGVDAGASSSRRRLGGIAGDKKIAELSVTEECKKKVVMAGLLERPGKRPLSHFGR